MHRKAALVSTLLMMMLPLFAAERPGNLQKILPVGSEVYKAITLIYINQGISLPSTTGPWSVDELAKMLDRIDSSRLKGGAMAAYSFASGALNEGNRISRFGLNTTTEAYWHRNTADFTEVSQWIRGSNERNPLFDLFMETWLARNFYGYSALTLQNTDTNGWDAANGATSTLWGQSALTTNIPLIPPAVTDDAGCNFPSRAFGSAGGDGWSLEVGRDRYSWGPGVTGNFILGDQILYHNMGRFTVYEKNFKYTFATSFFPYPGNYYPIMDEITGSHLNQRTQNDVVSGLNMFMGHRLEWRLFHNKVGFVLTEAAMYQSATSNIDLSILSPTAVFHNYFERGNANSILSAEADWTPMKHLDLYTQLVVDEFALPSEAIPGLNAAAYPNALGFMAGAKASLPYGGGMLFGSAEWARTDPYLYLRDNGNHNQNFGEYGINWVVAMREFYNPNGVNYTEQFLGYRYGCDAIVFNANFGFRRFGRWSLEGNIFYMIHGTHDQWTTWGDHDGITGNNDPATETTPTTTHVTDNNADIHADERDSVSCTLVVGTRASWSMARSLEVFGQADFIHITNPGNIAARAPIWDLQITAGLTIRL